MINEAEKFFRKHAGFSYDPKEATDSYVRTAFLEPRMPSGSTISRHRTKDPGLFEPTQRRMF